MPLITAHNISKIYQSRAEKIQALKNVDLTIEQGDFIVVNGPSGSGKSTLLNLISGIDQPTKGEIQIDNTSLSSLKDKERTLLRRNKIGLVFQHFELIPVLTAWENVEYPLLLQDLAKSKRKTRVDQILEQVGLHKMADRRPNQLSGGQKQRVAIARALVTQPEVVLADEPTGNLDIATGEQILQLMLTLNQKYDVAFIIVTHDLKINQYAKKLIEIKDGNLIIKEGLNNA
ncbi:MAG: ABC transporter ATP-binding protein [Bacillota bacterium]